MLLPDWAHRARPLDEVTLEIGFLIDPDFYYGPDRFSQEQWERLREPVYRPVFEIYVPPTGRGEAQFALTRSIEDSVDELVRYYSDLLRLITKHKKKPLNQRLLFSLQPILFSPGGEFELRLFLNDHWETAASALQDLEQLEDGVLYDALEEHWACEVIAHENRLYIRVTDPDAEGGEKEVDCVCCDRPSIIRQVGPVRERTRAIRSALKSAFATDYWSLEWIHRAWQVPHREWMEEVDAFSPR